MITEECKKISELINCHNGRIPKLKEKLDRKWAIQTELDEVALTAEILEEKGWEKKREKAGRNREEIAMLRSEIEKQEKAIEILKEKGERAI